MTITDVLYLCLAGGSIPPTVIAIIKGEPATAMVGGVLIAFNLSMVRMMP